MSEKTEQRFDLFDFICDLDERIERLRDAGYVREADALRDTSSELKGYVELRLADAESSS